MRRQLQTRSNLGRLPNSTLMLLQALVSKVAVGTGLRAWCPRFPQASHIGAETGREWVVVTVIEVAEVSFKVAPGKFGIVKHGLPASPILTPLKVLGQALVIPRRLQRQRHSKQLQHPANGLHWECLRLLAINWGSRPELCDFFGKFLAFGAVLKARLLCAFIDRDSIDELHCLGVLVFETLTLGLGLLQEALVALGD